MRGALGGRGRPPSAISPRSAIYKDDFLERAGRSRVPLPQPEAAISRRFGVASVRARSSIPAVAALPLAVLVTGSHGSAVRVVVACETAWPLALGGRRGFQSRSSTLVAVGQNIGLSRRRVITDVLAPSALPSAIAGLEQAWALAWRALVAAELVLAAGGQSGGLGNDVASSDSSRMFAALLTVAIVSGVAETLLAILERRTVVRWGMK